MTARRMFSSRALGAGALLALAGPGVAACDSEPEYVEQQTRFTCAIDRDGQQEAVDCDDVDDDDGRAHVGGVWYPVFIHSYPATGAAYTPGTKLPAGQRIGFKDAAGRQQWGLPPSGRIGNNTVKTNVVGKGGAVAPAGAKAGG